MHKLAICRPKSGQTFAHARNTKPVAVRVTGGPVGPVVFALLNRTARSRSPNQRSPNQSTMKAPTSEGGNFQRACILALICSGVFLLCCSAMRSRGLFSEELMSQGSVVVHTNMSGASICTHLSEVVTWKSGIEVGFRRVFEFRGLPVEQLRHQSVCMCLHSIC